MARKALTSIIKTVESANSEAPIEKQFITDLIYSIEKSSNEHRHTPSRAFKPSSIGGCERNLYYQLIGAEPSTDGRTSANNVGILESGTDRHIRIQEAICEMQKNGIDCEYIDVADYVKSHNLDYIEIKEKSGIETKCFWADIPLSFLTDGIIRYKGKYYILEIKTMNSKKFFESKSVRDEHKSQGICYSLAFKIDGVIYLYENRETLDKKAFLFNVTDEMRQSLLDKTNRVKKCVAEGVPPEVTPSKMRCRYCNYSQLCEPEIS